MPLNKWHNINELSKIKFIFELILKKEAMNSSLVFKTLEKSDWALVSKIYQEGLDTGHASFETRDPSWEEWDNKHLKHCRIVAELNHNVIGWAALSPISSRYVYRGVAEVSIYVSNEFKGQKTGTKLLEKLIIESESHNIWTLQSGVFPENKASIAIHKNLGFREVGFREKIGKINGVWRNTILLEHRSKIIGID